MQLQKMLDPRKGSKFPYPEKKLNNNDNKKPNNNKDDNSSRNTTVSTVSSKFNKNEIDKIRNNMRKVNINANKDDNKGNSSSKELDNLSNNSKTKIKNEGGQQKNKNEPDNKKPNAKTGVIEQKTEVNSIIAKINNNLTEEKNNITDAFRKTMTPMNHTTNKSEVIDRKIPNKEDKTEQGQHNSAFMAAKKNLEAMAKKMADKEQNPPNSTIKNLPKKEKNEKEKIEKEKKEKEKIEKEKKDKEKLEKEKKEKEKIEKEKIEKEKIEKEKIEKENNEQKQTEKSTKRPSYVKEKNESKPVENASKKNSIKKVNPTENEQKVENNEKRTSEKRVKEQAPPPQEKEKIEKIPYEMKSNFKKSKANIAVMLMNNPSNRTKNESENKTIAIIKGHEKKAKKKNYENNVSEKSFDRLYNLQMLLKKESSIKELCKLIYINNN